MAGRFTLDSATEFLFGQCVNSLSAPLPTSAADHRPATSSSPFNPNNRFADALWEAQMESARRSRIRSIWPLFEIFKDRTKDSMDFLHGYIDPIIKVALRKKSERNKAADPNPAETLLDHLVDMTDGQSPASLLMTSY